MPSKGKKSLEKRQAILESATFVSLFRSSPGVVGETFSSAQLNFAYTKSQKSKFTGLKFDAFTDAFRNVAALRYPKIKKPFHGHIGLEGQVLKLAFHVIRNKKYREIVSGMEEYITAWIQSSAQMLQRLLRGYKSRRFGSALLALHTASMEVGLLLYIQNLFE